MQISRRDAMRLAAFGAHAAPWLRGQAAPAIAPGPFRGTRESLKNYHAPEWFRDAKFGIWAHWGPQSAAEYGDWYARNMYIEGHKQYQYHVSKYGHPSKFGFKDVIQTWKAEKFDPDALMALYKKAGAKYFVSMGVHHDNFDLWNSKHQRWNAVNMGPKKDIVGAFRTAARKQGLRFGVSEHLAVSYHWFQTSHGADKEGPLKGVKYDGADPKYASLYHETHDAPQRAWDETGVAVKWKEQYFLRIKDLIDQYEPDLMYTDGPIFFGDWGLALMAHHYNRIGANGNKIEAVWATKGKTDCVQGTCVLDLERGVVDRIWDEPWQTDTCVGTWHYNKEAVYKTPKIVVDMLVDIVSRNGNLLLNFPLPSSGMLDAAELKILDEIAKWMSVNGEAIYGTRPWKSPGEGPAVGSTTASQRESTSEHHQAAAFNERSRKPLGPEDVRYTTKSGALYAFMMGWPQREATIRGLAPGGAHRVGKIQNVELLGFTGKLQWRQDDNGLSVQMPPVRPADHAVALKLTGV